MASAVTLIDRPAEGFQRADVFDVPGVGAGGVSHARFPFAHRRIAALRAEAERSAFVSFAARALPPFWPICFAVIVTRRPPYGATDGRTLSTHAARRASSVACIDGHAGRFWDAAIRDGDGERTSIPVCR